MKKIPPMFRYYGGKHRASGRYAEPEHDTIVEPFAGSAGYSHRYWDRNVILVDSDPVICAVWRYLISADAADILDLPLVPPGADLRKMRQLSDAERWLIGFWVNNGVAKPCNVLCKWAREQWPDPAASFWGPRCRRRLASHVHCVDHWQIIEGEYNSAPDVEATWHIDPPYVGAGKYYRHGSAGIDYAALGEWCRTRRGQVTVCENAGADWLPFRPLYDMPGAAKDGAKRKRSVEAVWTND